MVGIAKAAWARSINRNNVLADRDWLSHVLEPDVVVLGDIQSHVAERAIVSTAKRIQDPVPHLEDRKIGGGKRVSED